MSKRKRVSDVLVTAVRESFISRAPEQRQAILTRLREYALSGGEQSNAFWGNVYEWLKAENSRQSD